MKCKLFKKAPILAAAFVTAAAMSLTACGDDSGSSKTPAAPVEDPTQQPTNPSTNPSVPQQPTSSSSEVTSCEALTLECGYTAAELCAAGLTEHCTPSNPTPETPAETGCAAGETPTPVAFPQDDWTDIGEVYKNIQCNEKVVFIVRHAQRADQTTKETPLTLDGAEAAIEAGKKLIGPGEFKFVNSGFLRTFQTVYFMAIGRGQYKVNESLFDAIANGTYATDLEEGFVVPTDFPVDTISQITDGWFLKDKALRDEYKVRDSIQNVNEMYSKWIYEGMYEDVYYNLDERCTEILNTYLVKDYSQMPKYTLMGSHDQFLMPLTSWATKKAINLTFWDQETKLWRWVGYLSGLAIIINDKNEIRYAPIKGMEKGYGK